MHNTLPPPHSISLMYSFSFNHQLGHSFTLGPHPLVFCCLLLCSTTPTWLTSSVAPIMFPFSFTQCLILFPCPCHPRPTQNHAHCFHLVTTQDRWLNFYLLLSVFILLGQWPRHLLTSTNDVSLSHVIPFVFHLTLRWSIVTVDHFFIVHWWRVLWPCHPLCFLSYSYADVSLRHVTLRLLCWHVPTTHHLVCTCI